MLVSLRKLLFPFVLIAGVVALSSCAADDDDDGTGDDDDATAGDDDGAVTDYCQAWADKVCACPDTQAQCDTVRAQVANLSQSACKSQYDQFACASGPGEDDDDVVGPDDDVGTDDDDAASDECPAGTECTVIQGGSVCLTNGQPPANATQCDPDTGAGCAAGEVPVGAQDQAGNTLCVCLVQCSGGAPAGDDDDTGGGECPAGTQCTEIQGGAVCLANGQPPANATQCDPNTGAGCATNEVPVSAQDQSGNTLCVCLVECSGAAPVGDDDTATGDCPAGLDCTQIQGGAVCLEGGQPPANATQCDPNTGAGCAAGEVPVSAQDQSGNTLCICLVEC